MALLDFFLSRKNNTANIARERLHIIITERRRNESEINFLPQLKHDILKVICRYIKITPDMVTIRLEHKEKDISILELNIALTDIEKIKN